MAVEAVREGRFDPAEFAEELAAAQENLDVGTTVWFENDRLRVWEVRLEPGERAPFHAHTTNYFWTVVEAGRGVQRFTDGRQVVREYRVGDTRYLEHTADEPTVHDLENVGDTPLRFVTVELIDG